jgi:hypothetical protein
MEHLQIAFFGSSLVSAYWNGAFLKMLACEVVVEWLMVWTLWCWG